ncbi:MAG TPA: LysR family transcriptional regulator [Phycisphaerae bacterium]|nr:LysR family transcriptional regulator [Phycisphaerae bacterium]
MPRIQRGPRKGREKAQSDAPPGTWEGRLRLWVDVKGHNALGPGKVRLLEAIAATRSLSAAAKQLQMSYRLAWKHLRLIEQRTGLTVVEPQRGGRDGGGTNLTAEGRALLKAYHDFHCEVEEGLASACQRHFARWSKPGVDGPQDSDG